MAGAMLLRPTASLCPRTNQFLTGNSCYSVKGAALEYFINGQLPQYVWKRSIYMSERNFSLVSTSWLRKSHPIRSNNDKIWLFSTKNACQPLSYSFRWRASDVNKGGRVDVEENVAKRPGVHPKLLSILPDSSVNLDHEFPSIQSDNFTDIAGDKRNEEEYDQIKVANKSNNKSIVNSSLHSTNVNKNDKDFEYDYQVAEDIEEYDYIDETKLVEQQVRPEKVLPISLQRGKTGVFDLHELVTLLEHLGAENIVTFPVPKAANFCDDMVVVSAKSQRHLQAINDELLWVHKRKKSQKDPHLVIEGVNKTTWCAMDMGNIVLHVFYGDDKREYYDIESLWTLGPDKDPKSLEQHNDPYALSPEDLFWLETGNASAKGTDTADPDDKAINDDDKRLKSAQADRVVPNKLADDVTDSEAGCGIPNSTSTKETK